MGNSPQKTFKRGAYPDPSVAVGCPVLRVKVDYGFHSA
jgi:hypothetical protein